MPGNPRCPGGTYASIKVDPGANGIFKDAAGVEVVQITSYDGKTFNWALVGEGLDKYDIASVIVKGGPNANMYIYENIDDDSDTGLHAPVNPNNDKYYGISHIQFCFDPKAT